MGRVVVCRYGAVGGGIAWLAGQVFGDLKLAVTRDLTRDQLDIDTLTVDQLWAYVKSAPPGTAIYHVQYDGWTVGDHLAAMQLHELRKIEWRYAAINFERAKELPFPTPIPRPGVEQPDPEPTETWETVSLEDMISPEVIALLAD